MGLAILSGGLAFVGSARATELIADGSFENTTPSSNPVVRVGGIPDPGVGQGWSTFSTYLYSTQYTMPGPAGAATGFLRPYPSGTYGITQSSTEAHQTVSLTTGTTLTPAKIDAGQATFTMAAWFSSYRTQGDYSDLTLEFLGEADEVVSFPELLGGSDFVANIPTGDNSRYADAKEWMQDVRTGTIPPGARKARVTIQSTSVGGAPDGYVDVVSLDVVDTTLTVPVLTAATPQNDAIGVGPVVKISVTLQNRTTSVDLQSIRLLLNDTPVIPSVTPSGAETLVAYNAGVLPALSQNTYRIIYGDTGSPSVSQTNTFSFTVADYVSLVASDGSPLGSEDTSKPGFNVHVFQVSSIVAEDPQPVQANIPGSIAFLESVLAGLISPNLADLSAASATNLFEVPGTINWVNSSGASGNFLDDTPFPGIPGTEGTEDSVVHEITTYLRFPAAGYYQIGVNNADAFRITGGFGRVQTLQISGATNYVIPCVPIATNITQLQFGGALPVAPLQAPVVYGTPSGFPDDGCTLAGDPALAGKVVLIDQDAAGGSCDSAAKAEQAQMAGAVAVLLITPGDVGYPFRVGDVNPNVSIPVLVIAEAFGGSELKALLTAGGSLNATIQTDGQSRLLEWDGPKGFGAVDALGGFAVPVAGVYPIRLVAGHTSGAANLEWFSIQEDGTRSLINQGSDANAILAFRARTAVVPPAVFNPPVLSGNSVTLSWTGSGVLEEASTLSGPWTAAPSQSNPQAVPVGDGLKVYRIFQ